MNRKLIFNIVLACIVGICGGLYYKNSTKKTFSQTTTPASVPVTIDIPAIHVQTHIEAVGLDKQNTMGVPNNADDVAWYDLGPEPGQTGNAVIDGHVDTQTGAPAVFAQLGKIKRGDTISISETQNITHTFTVTSVKSFPTDTFPADRIFGSTTGSYLNLITCDGTWDTKKATYTKRLVVFSRLIK